MEIDDSENTMHVETEEGVEQPSTSNCQPTPTISTLYKSIAEKPQSVEELIDQSKVQDSCSSNDQGLGNIMEGKLELEQARAIFKKIFGEDIPMDGEYDWTRRDHFQGPCTNDLQKFYISSSLSLPPQKKSALGNDFGVLPSPTSGYHLYMASKDDWIAFVEVYLNDLINSDDLKDPENQVWLIVVPNEENPADTIIYCRICRDNFDEMFLQGCPFTVTLLRVTMNIVSVPL